MGMRSSSRNRCAWSFLATFGLLFALTGGSCQPPQAQNHAPQADAGNNQTVAKNAAVTLDGTGSNDQDGDTLTFQWQQLSGTNVTLSGANTDTATLTAPNANTVLTFQL